MRSKENSLWLGLSLNDHATTLRKTERLDKILSETQGEPSLILCIGQNSKAQALRWMSTPLRSGNSGRRSGEIHLRQDAGAHSIRSQRPLLIADGPIPDIDHTVKKYDINADLDSDHRHVPWCGNNLNSALLNIYSHLMGPFTDVVTLFLSDFADLRAVAKFLATWLDDPSSPSVVHQCLPALLIVVECSGSEAIKKTWEADKKASLLRYVRQYCTVSLKIGFSRLAFHCLPNDMKIDKSFLCRSLKDRLLKESDEVRSDRINKHLHFNCNHFVTLFDATFNHFVSTEATPLNFIRAARLKKPVTENISVHFREFLRHFQSISDINTMGIQVVASCLLLDSFPTGMHNYEPIEVFRELYHDEWTAAIDSLSLRNKNEILPIEHIIQQQYILRNQSKYHNFKPQHLQTLSRFHKKWNSIHSDATCLLCLCRRPEYSLPCGHCFCGDDIRRFGAPVDNDTDEIEIDHCELCRMEGFRLRFKFKPKTKGTNVISFDGGGVRGIIPLVTLWILQEILKPYFLNYPVQNHFGVSFGSSSGGTDSTALFLDGIPVEECIELFTEFCKHSFARSADPSDSLIFRFVEFVRSYFSGSLYSAENIEESLQQQFGSAKTLLDHSYATSRGTKVGVTATGTSAPFEWVVLTNYNRAGVRSTEYSYSHILPDFENRVKVWEAMRATTAAPRYFQPCSIDKVGTYQDGGLWNNCPIDVAMGEAISLTGRKPDLTLSLGTGYSRSDSLIPSSPAGTPSASVTMNRITKPFGWENGGFIARAFEPLKLHADSSRAYKKPNSWNEPYDICETTSEQRHFRLDTMISGVMPALDDVSAMEMLQKETLDQHRRNSSLVNLASSLIAKSFYFELTSQPMARNGHYTCHGHILCSIGPKEGNRKILPNLLDKLTNDGSQIFIDHRATSGYLNDAKNFEPRTHKYRQKVEIHVKGLDDRFHITLKLRDPTMSTSNLNISASPFTLKELMDIQGWKNRFGCSDDIQAGPKEINIDRGSFQKHRKRPLSIEVTKNKRRKMDNRHDDA